MTYSDQKLYFEYGDDEKCRAQNKTSSDRVEEYAFRSICSLELDLAVYAEYRAIDTYNIAFICRLK